MKTDMFSSLKVIHGAARSTALSVAASMVLAAALAAPVSTFAATSATSAKTSKHAKAGKKPAAPAKVSSKAAKAGKAAAAKTAAADDDAPRASVKRKRVTYTTNGRHHTVVRRVAYEPRPPTVGQAFGLHETPDALMLRSSVAYVVDQNTGEPLFDKNSRAVVPIASITKLMTAMVVLDSKEPMTDQLEVTDEDRDYEKNTGSRLSVGSVLSREDMLHIALMASENRAAAALSRYYPGGRPAFLAAMNAKARQLGMTDTHFENPTGLTSQNVSSARDLVKMVNAAYQYPLIRRFSTDHSYEVYTGKRTLAYNSTNALVRNPTWDIGLQKTGFINEAGECLVMQANIHGRPMVLVLLDSSGKYSRFADATRLRTWLDNGGDQARITSADAGGPGT
ncbi:D-alanyl-D-alanine endopeptidase [bacterium M00.F.Ca.ET.228.01.1.1]|uniref:D-alanyl-D-alanine endopeptidase n=1 Tax=Paraburkholderia phenoliruptrix TaxID=252970 RepID=UPI001092E2F5|nr:D-alanyl-D-alanine endopeptidase [Paraburkholderia phenoliruptrix]TGP41668.1 D-alanyl-D-alanine endopeptidase [bacterium M00.F.Ca.ET.228.01.1.1]TGR98458.1 D-alanyl-D-alanine endopeptidase [bacterium M00.F.Ca.ET.191.01.1.1]TGU02793.1 D-alanyl-D-alanine endopeptidase [bacterium M00.F.Ca.ET.155.01.1.1]MBW0447537.1 D-alanyl-D-alanine endopeptidase [Paraburkholderia phenoliruptrix]MBW9098260.1 D-alanyl-D-alanine endopeptidase [Paraburkholderia phenoliruptrix]